MWSIFGENFRVNLPYPYLPNVTRSEMNRACFAFDFLSVPQSSRKELGHRFHI